MLTLSYSAKLISYLFIIRHHQGASPRGARLQIILATKVKLSLEEEEMIRHDPTWVIEGQLSLETVYTRHRTRTMSTLPPCIAVARVRYVSLLYVPLCSPGYVWAFSHRITNFEDQLALKVVNAHLIAIMINRLTINLHRSVKSNTRASLTPSAVPQNVAHLSPRG
ncbi:hypothetical protein JB92DRAFT_3093381 [Gautieria morchelliformis]|nr:hypothetical protein JB92DRAFT_3093381 [Gautieria morchelliformis]